MKEKVVKIESEYDMSIRSAYCTDIYILYSDGHIDENISEDHSDKVSEDDVFRYDLRCPLYKYLLMML